jgi:hypothetical protein
MSEDPDVIRRRIERTRADLGADVDLLSQKVDPRQVVRRRTNNVRRFLWTARDRVMGSAYDARRDTAGAVSSGTQRVADTASSAASSAADVVTSAPRVARQQTQGNPLAAGVVAFGVGYIVGSLLPPSEPEQRLGAQVKETAQEPVTQELSSAAQQAKQQLREPAQRAAESVKATAQEAASTVKKEGAAAATDVTDQAQESTQAVREGQPSTGQPYLGA